MLCYEAIRIVYMRRVEQAVRRREAGCYDAGPMRMGVATTAGGVVSGKDSRRQGMTERAETAQWVAGRATFGEMDECTRTGLAPNVMQMETKTFLLASQRLRRPL